MNRNSRQHTGTALSSETDIPAGRKGCVRVQSRVKTADSQDLFEAEGRGECVDEGTKLVLVYAERTPEGGTAECRLTHDGSSVVLHRAATVGSTMHFVCGRTTDMVCTTPYGKMHLRLRTLRCEVRADADRLTIGLDYELLQADVVVSTNSLNLIFCADRCANEV